MSAQNPTIGGMLAAGELVPAPRVTREALLLAVEVLEAYEPDADDPGAADLAAVAAMLRAEAHTRALTAWINTLTKEAAARGLNTNTPQAKSVIRRIAEERAR